MSFTVGLDFGTHQTKVCIEDASNPAQKLYEFVEFLDPNGSSSVLFPSIVQINEDDTVSYGYVDEGQCKYVNDDGLGKPKMPDQISQPYLVLPNKPSKPVFPPEPKADSWKDRIQSLFYRIKKEEEPDITAWKEDCSRLNIEYDLILNQWDAECSILQQQYNQEIETWKTDKEKREEEYTRATEEWNKTPIEKLHYRYFKLATFSDSIKWANKISPEIISIWYITYILLLLQEKLGEDFFTQTGIPSGTNESVLKRQKNKAFSILISAYKLAELYKTKEAVLVAKFSTLLETTKYNRTNSDEDIVLYGLNVLPEAYAGLSSITQQKRLETGMSLLVDIGGGTTDIAFFTIREDQPDIHAVISFPRGLNYIFEQYIKQNGNLSVSDVQDIFFKKKGDRSLFLSSISKYHIELSKDVKKMVTKIQKSFEFRRDVHKLPASRLRDALDNRPVVFCGGGAIYNSMQTSVLNFTDIKLINKNLLNIPSLINMNIDDKLYTILATSYGLSIPLEDEIVLTSIEKVFDHIVAPESNPWDYGYEHGLSDI